MLKVGDKAPEFSLPSSDMEIKELSDFLDKTLVLYFYPKDDTPGCTIQANDFNDTLDEYESAGAHVVGVSGDDCFSHQAFMEKFGLSLTLLSDVDGDMRESYGVMQEKEKNGITKLGLVRSTFIINKEGLITYAEYGVAPKDHADKILEIIKSGI